MRKKMLINHVKATHALIVSYPTATIHAIFAFIRFPIFSPASGKHMLCIIESYEIYFLLVVKSFHSKTYFSVEKKSILFLS